MNTKLIILIPNNTKTDLPPPTAINLDGAGIGLVGVGVIGLIVSMIKGSEAAWKASQEIIDDLKKHLKEKDEVIAELTIDKSILEKRVKRLERASELPSELPSMVNSNN